MSKAKKPNGTTFTDVYIQPATKTIIWPTEERKNAGTGFPDIGVLEIAFYVGGEYHNQRKAHFPLVSAWLDPTRGECMKTCKVHALVPTPQNVSKTAYCKGKMTAEHRNAVEVVNFIANMSGDPFLPHRIRPSHSLRVDPFGKVVRYGSEETPYTGRGADSNHYGVTPIYDNKAEAFCAIMDAIKGSGVAVAGLDLINLNAIDDDLMEEAGFTKVLDIAGVGVPMWCGDAEKIASLGRRSYGSYGYRKDGNEATSKEVVDSLMDLIEMSLT